MGAEVRGMFRSPKLVSALVLVAGIAPFGRVAFAAASSSDANTQPVAATAETAAPAPAPAAPAPAPAVAPAPAPAPTAPEATPEPEPEATPEPAVESAAAEAPAPAVEEPTVLAPAAADTTLSGAAAEFLAATNASRDAVGAAPLQANATLTAYAVAHARTMATGNNLHHSDISVLLHPWSTVGENVGVGPSVAAIHTALLASPGHYRNLADPGFTHVGIGVTTDAGGRTWTAHVFGI